MEIAARAHLAERLQAALTGSYVVSRELGSGGASVVFLAEDVKHSRRVAIKVLKPELSATLSEERFLRETRVAARLVHPHIVPLIDSGEGAGLLYYIMPFMEGESLARKLAREGRLGLDEALRLSQDVGAALDYAHRNGHVHRDVKPDNILLCDGRAILADFGIAYAMELAGGERFTQAGAAVGTPHYMSPEQAAGERQLDARSDVYGLGCIVYEMLVGEPPYDAPTAAAIMVKHATGPVPSARHRRPEIPVAADSAIARALAKDPADRFATATDFAIALGSAGVAPDAQVLPGIVVLPFAVIGPDAEQQYFGDGIVEQLIADLSQVGHLRVISRNTTMLLKGAQNDLRAISKQLGVQYVIDGSVARSGEAIRITTQLTDARNDSQLWGATHKGTLAEVFDFQERISRAVVDALKVKLTREEDRRLHERPISDVHAYDCYLRARGEIWRCTEDALDRARLLLQNGLDLVGDNALLYATLGEAHWQYINMAISSDEKHLTIAEGFATKALALDPQSAAANVLAGEVHWKKGAMHQAIGHLRAALETDPNHLEALLVLSYIYAFVGKAAAARPLCAKLLRADPLTPLNHGVAAYIELFDGRLSAALAPAQRMYQLDPESPLVRWIYSVVVGWNGRISDSPWNLEWATTAQPDTTLAAVCKLLNHALVNDKEGAARSLPPDLCAAARWDEQMSWHIGACYALLGETSLAIDWLENAFRRGFWNYPFLSQYDPFLESLRSEPAFEGLLARVRDEWSRIEL